MEYKDLLNRSFLGRGWSFPPTFHNKTIEGIEMVENEVDIKESLEILLNTSVGERIMLPEYGCDIRDFLFESITTSKLNFLRELILTAITKYEPRIDLNEINIDPSEYQAGIIKVFIDYSIITTNTRFNLVFPYYQIEGTDLPRLYHKQVSNIQVNNE